MAQCKPSRHSPPKSHPHSVTQLTRTQWHFCRCSECSPDHGARAFPLTSVAQYKAWCANDGHHCTAKRGRQDWNAKIIWKMRSELAFQWDVVEEDIPELFSGLCAEVEAALADMKAAILGMSFSGPGLFLGRSVCLANMRILERCDGSSCTLVVDTVESARRQFRHESYLCQQRFTQEFR